MLVISIFLIFLTAQAQDFANPFPHDDNSPSDSNENRRCPKWQAWENVTCWWPSRSYDSLPQSCTNLTLPSKVPAVIRELFENEIRDKYNMIVNEYNARGKPAICGHCSLSFRCRVRKHKNLADDGGDFEEEDFGKRGHRKHDFCPPKQVQPIRANCSDTKPCQIKKVFGGCPTPFFLKRGGHRRAHSHMENGDYEKAIDELVNSFQMPIDMPQDGSEMNMEGQENGFRQKRQSGFAFVSSNDQDYPTSDFQVPSSNFDAPAPPSPPMGYRRWRPWLGNRYSNTRPGLYPSDRVGDYGSMDMGQPGNANFGGGQGFSGMGNMMFGRRHGGPRGGINEDGHRKRRPSPKQIIIYWLLHGTKCISSGNTCLCCCGHFVPNAQNKTCDDLTKLHPHFSNMVETSFPQDDNADFSSQLPMMTSIDDNKRPRFPDYSNFKLDKNPDALY